MRTLWVGLLAVGCSSGFELEGAVASEDGGAPMEVPTVTPVRVVAWEDAGEDTGKGGTPEDVAADVAVEGATEDVLGDVTTDTSADTGVDVVAPEAGEPDGAEPDAGGCPGECVSANYLYTVTGVAGPGAPLISTCPEGATLVPYGENCDCFYSASMVSVPGGWLCQPNTSHECVLTIRCDGPWCAETGEACLP